MGKDIVSRVSMPNIGRLIDELVRNIAGALQFCHQMMRIISRHIAPSCPPCLLSVCL